MSIAVQYINITVHDVDAALPFYRDGLGLEVLNDVPAGEHRWLTLGSPEQPDVALVLSDPHAGRSKADGDLVGELLAKGTLLGPIIFRTDDLDSTFEKVRQTGAEVMQEPSDQPWGPRDCAFRDPSGNHVRISQA
ncbi:VOC family protein [Pseudolysinimonas kribbensis]|uniref:Lyase n=1 Tax=Pseudolysinimonas kribbensis TaxID=433641 RepID=A0ABQ6K7U7_9MICO|nr:VOC family protein [Pseudolysinimonas kribbensis]GMA96735.1 lyase [Pseudolysinimonas kribbensis]